MRVRAALVSTAAVGALLSGCGSGSAPNGTGPTSAANPRLAGPAAAAGPAAGLARDIAARWALAHTAATTPDTPILFRSIDVTASIFDPGTATGFTAFITSRRSTLVTPASAASVEVVNDAPARFATPADQTLWQADHSPSLGQSPAGGQRFTIPAGQYSFLPQGSTLTYRQAAALPGDADQLATSIRQHLRPYAGVHPPPAVQLRALAYLIATAALTNTARSAAWQAVSTLPGLRTCTAPPGRYRTHTANLCIDSPTDEIRVLVDSSTGTILTIAEQLLRPSPLYPHVRPGTVIESSTFIP